MYLSDRGKKEYENCDLQTIILMKLYKRRRRQNKLGSSVHVHKNARAFPADGLYLAQR